MLELADGIFARLPAPPHIALTHFELSPLDFGEEGEPVQATDRTASVMPLPTAGDLHATIEPHLQAGRASAPTDAAVELRRALCELRRSPG